MDYFDRLKDEMSFQDITQKELADVIGVSINTIRGWFSKKVLPDLESAFKIAQFLKQPVEYFMNGEIFPPNNYHLPTREIRLLENYDRLSTKEKNAVDNLVKTLAGEIKPAEDDIFK